MGKCPLTVCLGGFLVSSYVGRDVVVAESQEFALSSVSRPFAFFGRGSPPSPEHGAE